jgi:nicotinate-nucleotide--dimethylbenzimidazole phosphoribosyltransferase
VLSNAGATTSNARCFLSGSKTIFSVFVDKLRSGLSFFSKGFDMYAVNETSYVMDDLDNGQLQQRLLQKMNNKTKPLGSLGRIEQLAIRLGLILGSEMPRLLQPQLVVCAADHGLAKHGVSAFPSDVTWQMVENFLTGGAAVSVLARQHGIALNVVDCGVKHDFAPRPGLHIRKQAYGSADSMLEPAMSMEQCQDAIHQGRELIQSLPGNAVLLGEMGIGNTSAAALILARLADLDIADCTGAGTGLDRFAVARKVETLRAVLQRTEEISPILLNIQWRRDTKKIANAGQNLPI